MGHARTVGSGIGEYVGSGKPESPAPSVVPFHRSGISPTHLSLDGPGLPGVPVLIPVKAVALTLSITCCSSRSFDQSSSSVNHLPLITPPYLEQSTLLLAKAESGGPRARGGGTYLNDHLRARPIRIPDSIPGRDRTPVPF
jgi:hypothetical protein